MAQGRRLEIVTTSLSPSGNRDVVPDTIFFHKSQLEVGATLIYYGRSAPRTRWRVAAIRSHYVGNRVGQWVTRPVTTARQLRDRVYLRSEATGELRNTSLQYISYSAIWRLAEG